MRFELRYRPLLAVALLSAWLMLLFTGRSLGGAVHLLLIASLVLFPWRGEPAG